MIKRSLALLTAVAAILLLFLLFVRPWYLRWGATDADLSRSLPGDEIIPNAAAQETRAISIAAPADSVWPWLAQLGQDRGGFYSYDLLENLVGCRMPTEDRLRPDRQGWQLGDKLWMYPATKAGGVGFATLRTYVPGRALAFGTRAMGAPLTAAENGSWSFVIEPTSAGESRLLVRGRGAPGRSVLGAGFDHAIFEPIHFAMERRTMLGIKALAEGSSRGRVGNHAQVVLWVLTFGLVIAGVIMVLRATHWVRAVMLFAAACALFQVLTLRQPPVLIGAALVVGVSWLLRWAAGGPRLSPS